MSLSLPKTPEALKLYEEAKKRRHSREPAQALPFFDQAIALEEDCALLWYDRGEVEYWRGSKDRSIDDFTRAHRLAPDYPWTLKMRGHAWQSKNEFEKAEADFTKGISLLTDQIYNHDEFFISRGNLYQEMKQFDKAVQDFDQAIAYRPDHPIHWSNRGHAYYDMKCYEAALADFAKCVELHPDIESAVEFMGHAYSRMEDHENAVLCFTQALELIHKFETDPDYFVRDWSEEKARYFYSRGVSYLSMGNHLLEAIDDAAAAIALEPENVDHYNLRGVSYLFMGEAEKRFAKDLQGGILGRKLTLAYLEDRIATRGRPELAKQMAQFRRLYDMNRDRSFAFLLDILGEMINDDCDNAIADFNKCIELVPDAAPYWCSRGRAWLQKNELKPAFDDLQQALALDPEHPLALQYMKEVQAE